MPQKQYSERPAKVLAEQYAAASNPPQKGVCTCTLNPTFPMPHAHTTMTGWTELHEGEWIVFSAIFPDRLEQILSDADFQAMYTGPPPSE